MAASCNGQQQKIYYVGIAGVTCGGKSTLADKLKTNLSDVAEVTIVHQDDFYVTKDRLPPLPALNYWNFDIPEAIEWERLINALPTASDKTTVVIIEGNIIFANDKIGKMCHQRYFIHASYDLIKAVRSSRNYDPPDVPGYFDQIAWPLYLQSKKDAEATGLPIIFLDAQNYETNCHQIHVDVCRQIIDDWVIISDQPISSQKAIDFVTSSCCGAISLFIGTTRDSFEGKPVLKLSYEAYQPMAEKQLHSLCQEVRTQWPTIYKMAIFHRIGEVPATQTSVIIAASSPHRKEAQNATQFAIDKLKTTVPIWKKLYRRYTMMVLVSGKKIPNVPGNQIEQSLGHLISKFRRHVENINANREDSEEQIV